MHHFFWMSFMVCFLKTNVPEMTTYLQIEVVWRYFTDKTNQKPQFYNNTRNSHNPWRYTCQVTALVKSGQSVIELDVLCLHEKARNRQSDLGEHNLKTVYVRQSHKSITHFMREIHLLALNLSLGLPEQLMSDMLGTENSWNIFYRPISQIPQCTCLTSHNTQFRTEMYSFLFWMVYCGMWDKGIVGLVRLV